MNITSNTLNETEPALHYLAYSSAENINDRPVLIFLHGVTSHAHYWDRIAAHFADDYQVYSLDFRGHGESAPAAGGYDRIEYFVADLRRLLAALQPSRFVLVGHSMGGYAAEVYATEGDPRLEKLVICDVKTHLTPDERESMQRSAAKPAPRFASLEDLAARFAATLRDSSADKGLLDELARQGAVENEDGTYTFKYDRQALNFPTPEPLKYAPSVTVPVLVINGQNSLMVPGADAAQLAAAFPNSRHLEIAQAGHHVFLDQPDEFSRLVRAFLNQPAP